MNGMFSRRKGNKTYLLLLAGFACYFLFALFHPFLHNHVIDGELYDDCGACLWVVISAGIFILFAGLWLIFEALSRIHPSCRPDFISGTVLPPSSRSPPAA